MNLESIEITNYRHLGTEEFELGGLIGFVGATGVGKDGVIHALTDVQLQVQGGQSAEQLFEDSFCAHVDEMPLQFTIRGSLEKSELNGITTIDEDASGQEIIGAETEAPNATDSTQAASLTLSCAYDDGVLTTASIEVEYDGQSVRIEAEYDAGDDVTKFATTEQSSDTPIRPLVERPLNNRSGAVELAEFLRVTHVQEILEQTVSQWQLLAPSRDAAVLGAATVSRTLASDGMNLPAVLHTLSVTDPELIPEIESRVTELHPFVEAVRFDLVTTANGLPQLDIDLVRSGETQPPITVDPSGLECLLFSTALELLSAEEGLLAIPVPSAHLGAQTTRRLVSMIEAVASDDCPIVLSSSSATLVDELPAESVTYVRNNSDDQAVLTPLPTPEAGRALADLPQGLTRVLAVEAVVFVETYADGAILAAHLQAEDDAVSDILIVSRDQTEAIGSLVAVLDAIGTPYLDVWNRTEDESMSIDNAEILGDPESDWEAALEHQANIGNYGFLLSLIDPKALATVLDADSTKVKRHITQSDAPSPRHALDRLYEEHYGRRFRPATDGPKIVEALDPTDRADELAEVVERVTSLIE